MQIKRLGQPCSAQLAEIRALTACELAEGTRVDIDTDCAYFVFVTFLETFGNKEVSGELVLAIVKCSSKIKHPSGKR